MNLEPGFIAWLAIGSNIVHVWYLIGFRNRAIVMFEWFWAYPDLQAWSAAHHQPHFSSLIWSFIHARSGAKYSRSAPGSPFPLAGDRLHGVLPRFARSHRQHRPQLLSGRGALVDRALVERSRKSRRLAERAVKLELVDVRERIARA